MKAEDTVTIDLSGKSTLADFMVVTCGRSNRHVGAVADRVLDDLARAGVRNTRVEGMPHCDWVLIDAGDVIEIGGGLVTVTAADPGSPAFSVRFNPNRGSDLLVRYGPTQLALSSAGVNGPGQLCGQP